MTRIEFNCRATAVGSMPQMDPAAACHQITRYLKEIPVWPQLPERSFREQMVAQYSQGFPGLRLTEDKIYVEHTAGLDRDLEELYLSYLANDYSKYPISRDYAAGLYSFLGLTNLAPFAIKGQVTGPITFAITVKDEEGKAILYDETLADAAAKLLRLKAAWQEKELKKLSPNTIIFVDEPSLASYGSAYLSISRERVCPALNEIADGIEGVKGIHCCGNTDWGMVLGANIDILNFDAYNYGQSLNLYEKEVKSF